MHTMLGTLLFTAIAGLQATGPTKGFSYTGIPYLTGTGVEKVTVPTHSANIELLSWNVARITTTTQFKNTTNQPLNLTVTIPWRIGDPRNENATSPRAMKIYWDGVEQQVMRPMIFPPVDTPLTVAIKPLTTHSLKVSLEEDTGTTGLDFKQRIVGYALTGNQPVGQLNIVYRYAGNLSGNTVFRLPKPSPDLRWSVGDRGSFVRLSNYVPKGDLTSIAFYPGGFEDIGR